MTNETKHTPGQWHVDEKTDDWGFIRDANGTLIANTRILDDEETIKKHRYPSTLGCPPQTLANARLISCAPELLEALEEVVQCCSAILNTNIKKYEQLIARAKGGND